jgi:hypothetical protein
LVQVEFREQVFHYGIAPLQDIVIPISGDSKTFACQNSIALLIAFGICVLATIDFDDQPTFAAYKVQNEVLKRTLATELDFRKSTVTEQMPHCGFGVSRTATHTFGMAACALFNETVVRTDSHDPSPGSAFGRATLSHKGRG